MNARKALRFPVALFAALLLSVSAHAQLFRAYVSPVGNDANPCNLAQPCRLLPAALAAVVDGGEIWMLDSANYNTATVTIGKSVSILAVPGVVGSVLAIGGPAISIATAGVKVALRNLVIAPLPGGGGTDGIHMTAGSALTVDNCLVANLPGDGVRVAAAAAVRIVDSVIRDNNNGVFLLSGAKAAISGSKMFGNAVTGVFVDGVTASTVTTAAISDSTISAHPNLAIYVRANTASATARASLIRSTISNNVYGAYVEAGDGPRLITISDSMVTGNTLGLVNAGAAGEFESLGNNTVRQNGTNKSGTITTVAQD